MEKKFCTECGSALNADGTCPNPDCSKAATKQKTFPSKETIQTQAKTAFQNAAAAVNVNQFDESGEKIVPDCVNPDQDEVPIRQYDIARLRSFFKLNFAEGRLQVTNKRIIFRTSGRSIIGPTTSQYEFALEEVAGVELRKEAHFNFQGGIFWTLVTALIYWMTSGIFSAVISWGAVSSILAVILAVVSVGIFFVIPKKAEICHLILSLCASYAITLHGTFSNLIGIKEPTLFESFSSTIMYIAYAINLVRLILEPNLLLFVKTKGGTPAFDIQRKKRFGIIPQEGTGFSQVIPGPDFDAAVKELGALIREIQHNGSIKND